MGVLIAIYSIDKMDVFFCPLFFFYVEMTCNHISIIDLILTSES